MGKPLSRPCCFRQCPCCLEKSVDGDGYNEDGYIPQRSIYDTMCINEQIDHGSAQSTITSRGGQDNNFSSNGNQGVGAGACGDMITFEARSTTPIPSMGRRLDERVIFDQLKLVEAGQSSRSAGRSVSPSVSLISAPGGNSSSSGKRHQHQHDSSKRGDNGQRSWKVLTPPKHLEHLELSSGDVMEKNFLNPLYLQHSMTSPLISPFSGSPLSSGCHTPVFCSPAKPLPFQYQSLVFEESPPSQPRHPPPKPPLAQLSVTALQCVQEDLRTIGGRDRETERKNVKGGEIEKKRVVSHSVGSMSQEENVGVFGFAPRTKALDSEIDNDSPFSPEPPRDTTPLLLDQISPGPAPARAVSPQPMESTWPRRLIVRKRTVRQGGAIHNFPILPPLPSLVVLSAMEKKNLPHLTPFSEHQGKLVGLMGRVGYSLKEQHLENWRVFSAKKTLQQPEKEGEGGEEQECKSSIGTESSIKEGDPESKEQESGARGGGAEGEEVEEWDTVLGMVNTLWDEGWGDAESYTGSLRHWPLLKPPSGFGGSHPPSSAASELSLLELERRAKDVESELVAEQCLTDSLRKKASQLTAEQSVVSGSVSEPEQISTQPSLELLTMGCSTGTKNVKEDGSPDFNLTLESDSSGVFMSNPSQTSQEDNASDGSDRPLTESDLGSNTSLDEDKDEVAFKDWGREESTELQWCYPSLLKSSSHCEGYGIEEEAPLMKDTEMGDMQSTNNEGPDNSDLHDGFTPLNQAELKPRNKSVKIISGTDSPLPLSPSRHEIPRKKSGLDSSDLDPFATTDSFVYLAVSVLPDVSLAQEEPPSLPTESTPPTSLSRPLCPNVEESDFLSTDSFVYLAGPECHLLATEGHSSFIRCSKGSDSSDDSGSGVDFVLGSMVGDSDWDSDESESGSKSKPIKQPTWDLWEELEQEVLSDLFCEEVKPVTEPVTEEITVPVTDQQRKVTWQFRAAEGSTRQTSKKDTSSSSSSSSSSSYSSTHTEV
uniref:Si:ch73-305o9.3 n=1 Tax=Oncorhynchus mykiss TaxID=8022 RepID=A0A8C7QD18_ONCMY